MAIVQYAMDETRRELKHSVLFFFFGRGWYAQDELKEAQRSKSELEDYVTALKTAHAHAVAVIESQISRVTGTLPLTSPDNILASL